MGMNPPDVRIRPFYSGRPSAERIIRNIVSSFGINVTEDTPGVVRLGLTSRFGVMSPYAERQWIMSLSAVERITKGLRKTVADVDFYQLNNKWFTTTWVDEEK